MAEQQVAAPPRQFQVNRTSFTRHYDVSSTDGQQAFYIDISSFTPSKPDLTVHEGKTSGGNVVAVAHMPKFSGDFKIGLGDPSGRAGDGGGAGGGAGGLAATRWEDMTKENLRHSEHRWAMTLGAGNDDGGGRRGQTRREFAWKRTRKVGADGASVSSLSGRNLKLVEVGHGGGRGAEEDGGKVLAVFTSERGFSSCGVLQINAQLGRDFDVMVVTTCVALYEKARRRRHRAAAGPGDGGAATGARAGSRGT